VKGTLVFALVVCGAASTVYACDDASSHIYTARAYDSARACLGPNLSIDVLAGPNPGVGCAPLCVVGRNSVVIGAPEVIYVTTMCAPHPPSFDISGKRAECTDALAALRKSDGCLADGGGAATRDATGDRPAEAGVDATDVAADARGPEPDATPADAALDASEGG
jgi:hypothetical protein